MSHTTVAPERPHTSAAPEPRQRSRQDPLVIRGYIKQVSDHEFVGVCLTLNLVVQGESQEATRDKLFALVDAYVADASEAGELHEWVPRRAPFSFYLEWWMFRLGALLHRIRDSSFYCFKAIRPPVHA